MKIKKILTVLSICILSVTVYADIKPNSANVIDVDVQGSNGAYNFYVTLRSDEAGCAQYANWWEVLNEEGNLLYRRILIHSHPTDQPFRRGGSSIEVEPSQTLYIRAHMNTSGYKGDIYKGSVSVGFLKSTDNIKNSSITESLSPQPQGCLF
ncbi:hypothetical protein JHD49_08990 [Sulfurimonas sp. SAG-AH-194-C21]|nr:hypothetical protein [Sulfurimonas sp. SAG-AH-194-C21]MDF1884072.1 hypothetical protein [Sulfurimonas sp. SAG-AH-194-C21]